MDPGTIYALVTTLTKCSYYIYDFCQQSRVIDQRLQALKRQTDGLVTVLQGLVDLLAREVICELASRNDQLWKSVAQVLEDCVTTVRELEQKLNDVGANKPKGNVFRQAVKTGRMAMNKDDIEHLQSALQTRSVNVQLAVGIVQLLATASSPDAVADVLAVRFDRLERMIVAVDEQLAAQSNVPASSTLRQDTLATVELDDQTKRLRYSATDVLSKASTTAGTLVSNAAPRAEHTQHSAFEYIETRNPIAEELTTAQEESTTGSEFGVPMQSLRRSEINDWVINTSIDDVGEEPENVGLLASTGSVSDPLTSVFSDLGVSSGLNLANDSTDLFDENSDDDELQLHVIKSFFARGKALQEAGEFQSAEGVIGRALQDAKTLTQAHQLALDMPQMQLQYALCCIKCGKSDVAEEILLNITNERIQDTTTVARVLHAYHGLALLHLTRGNLDAAMINCRQALKNRRRAKGIGKAHPDYIASLRLITLLTWAKGDQIGAEVYNEMLPDGQKASSAEFDTILEREYGFVSRQTPASRQNTGPTASATNSATEYTEGVGTVTIPVAHENTTRKGDSKTTKNTEFPAAFPNTSNWKHARTLSGHSNWIWAVAFSPDGTYIASSSADKTIKLWEVTMGEVLSTLTGHSQSIHSVAFSPDGKLIASGSYDKTIKLWDVATAKACFTLTGHSDWIQTVAFSPDGKQLASGADGGTIRLWDVATGNTRATLTAESLRILTVAFSPDGKFLASGGHDKTVKLWNVSTGEVRSRFAGHSQAVRTVAFSPDGKYLASGSSDELIKLWDMITGEVCYTLTGYSQTVQAIAFSPDGKWLASGSYNKTIKMWDIATGEVRSTLTGHSQAVLAVAFSSDGKYLASGSNDRMLILWEKIAE